MHKKGTDADLITGRTKGKKGRMELGRLGGSFSRQRLAEFGPGIGGNPRAGPSGLGASSRAGADSQ